MVAFATTVDNATRTLAFASNYEAQRSIVLNQASAVEIDWTSIGPTTGDVVSDDGIESGRVR